MSNNLNVYILLADEDNIIELDIPKIDQFFIGTGDLFTALLLIWMNLTNDLKQSMEKTVATIQAVLHRTIKLKKQFKFNN